MFKRSNSIPRHAIAIVHHCGSSHCCIPFTTETTGMSATQLEETPSADTAKRFKHPFTECREWVYYDDDDDDPTEKDTPRTLIELRMCALSAAIREKPEWWVKCRDKIIQAKWREEIKEQQKDLHRSLQLTDNMVRGFDSVPRREHSLSMSNYVT